MVPARPACRTYRPHDGAPVVPGRTGIRGATRGDTRVAGRGRIDRRPARNADYHGPVDSDPSPVVWSPPGGTSSHRTARPDRAPRRLPMAGRAAGPVRRAPRDLRISVTDRCNFRCPYCMPAEVFGATSVPAARGGAVVRGDREARDDLRAAGVHKLRSPRRAARAARPAGASSPPPARTATASGSTTLTTNGSALKALAARRGRAARITVT